MTFAQMMLEDKAAWVVVGPEEGFATGPMRGRWGDQGLELAEAGIPDARPEMHQVVAPRRGVPDPDALVVARRHDLVAARRPLHARHGPIVRDGVEVEEFPARVVAQRGWCADHTDGVVEVEGREGRVGAPDVEEQDPPVARARGQDVRLARRPGDAVHRAVWSGHRVRGQSRAQVQETDGRMCGPDGDEWGGIRPW